MSMKTGSSNMIMPYEGDDYQGSNFPEIELHTLGLFEIPQFPLDALPPPLGDIAARRAELVCTHPDYMATAMLAVAGASIGRSMILELKRGFLVWPSAWYCIVALVGAGKSPAIKFAHAPLVHFEDVLEAQNETIRQQHEASCAAIPRGEPKPPFPIPRRVLIEEATFAALVQIHAGNPFGLLYSPDEMTTWLRGMDVNSKGNSVDRSKWLTARQGSSISQDRIAAGTRRVSSSAITLLGSVPPEMLNEFLGSDNDGLIERLLFSYPHFDTVPLPLPPDYSDTDEDSAEWSVIVNRLLDLRYDDAGELRAQPCRFRLNSDPDAATAYYEFECRMVERLNDAEGPIRGFYSKIKYDVGHWAMTLALMDMGGKARRVLTATDDTTIVRAGHIQRAEAIANYYLASAQKVLSGGPKINRIDRRIIRRIVKTKASQVDSSFLNACFNSKDRPDPEHLRKAVERLYKARVFLGEEGAHLIVNPRSWDLRSF